MAENDKYKYLMDQGWSKEDAEKYISHLEQGRSPSEAVKIIKEKPVEQKPVEKSIPEKKYRVDTKRQEYGRTKESAKYSLEDYKRRPEKYQEEPKPERGFVRPKVFETEADYEEYMSSLSPKERYEKEAYYQGFRSGEEKRKAVDVLNKEFAQKYIKRHAGKQYGTPEEKYYEIEEKARGLYEKGKQASEEIRSVGMQIAGLDDRSEAISKLKEGAKKIIGAAALAATPMSPSDIRNLERIRKKIKEEEAKLRKQEADLKHEKELEKIAAAGGVLTPKQRYALEKYKAKVKYGGKTRTSPRRGRSPLKGAFGGMGGFNVNMETQAPQRYIPTRKVVRQVEVRPQPTEQDPFKLNKYAGMGSQRPPIERTPMAKPKGMTEVRYAPTNPVNDRSANKLVDMKGFGRGSLPVSSSKPVKQYTPLNNPGANKLVDMGGRKPPKASKKKKSVYDDPTGASEYY